MFRGGILRGDIFDLGGYYVVVEVEVLDLVVRLDIRLVWSSLNEDVLLVVLNLMLVEGNI